ncbi:hypothetical protein [Paenibacillus thalictri]|uniref:Uncharacterized protein n=1 Tax=Paenibacillus thalictri TaxID=2527873 RepID=A0A4Q9DLB2_9BACL|nr:hypothetical protein [Paenibacillus thalictri]TBL74515.1 hypothetical protein EYB31_24620 [Paenibacillus thalictri]
MVWLMALVVVVMVAGLVVTVMIGQSKSNKEENPAYFQNTGKKWLRLGWIYVVGIALAVVLSVGILNW